MKLSHKYLYILAAVVMLSCLQSCQQHEETIISKNTVLQDKNHENVSDTSSVHVASQPFQDFANVRQPDKRVRARKGHALLIETEGLSLAATDTAVIRSDTYSVTSLFPEELPPLPQGMMNMTAATAGYRLLPGGEHFRPYAELRMAYDPERLPQGYTPYDIYTSFYDTATLAWVRLERVGVDTVNHEIVSLTTHFTDFINELLKAPEMPETQAFVPTALSDLEAANPMDGLTMIQPPTANNNGTANISYPLEIPAGRAGMQPNLTLTYSSTGGSGWLGAGWDISVPSITLDTRWGVPRYDGTYETEIYLLNGEQLVTKDKDGIVRDMPHRTNQQTNRLPDGTQFYARTGDAHDSIIRHGDSPKNYWWEVVDRQGVTHYYGRYYQADRRMDIRPSYFVLPNRLPSGVTYDSSSNTLRWTLPTTLCDNDDNIARWVLTESRDTYGNTVRYYYDQATVRNRGAVGRQIYLDSISYTGHNDTDGYYTVVFCRTGNITPDIPEDCNNGFKEITDQLLNSVYLKCGNEIKTIWNFELENSELSGFKNRLVSVTKIDSVGNMRMRDLLDTMCHCIRQDEDEFATAGADSLYYLRPKRDSLVLRTVHVPICRLFWDKRDSFTPNSCGDVGIIGGACALYPFVHDTLYYIFYNTTTFNDSLFRALYDSLFYQASYTFNDSLFRVYFDSTFFQDGYNAEYFRWYRYNGYEDKVDSVWLTIYDSIPYYNNPLSSFSTFDYAGTVTNFEYYNAPSSESLFGDEMTIDLNGKNLHGFFLSDPLNTNPATRLRSRATGLGLSTASSWNVGGAATVGLGPVVCLTNASLGGNYTRSGSSSETKMTLVDLDGDGLNDKVYVKGNKLYFCRQYWNESNSTFNFGEPKVVHGIHHIMQSNSSSNTFGVQAALYASASASWTDTKSTTSSYFADVNADGLVDLIDGGQVYFNHCAKDSVPVFLRYSAVPISNPSAEEADVIAIAESMGAACGDIIFDGAANDSINCRRVWVRINTFTTNVKDTNIYTWLNEHSVDTMYSMSLEKGSLKVEVYHRELDCSYHDESPATDAVRVWIAPRNGAVDITSKIQLIEDTTPSRSVARHADGVVLSIQKTENISHGQSRFYPGSTNTHLTDILMVDTDYTMHVDSGRRVDVDSGDMIFFRLRSKADYHFDDVYTHFIIDYTDSSDFLGEKNKWHFDSQEDFVLSSNNYFQAPVDGQCKVQFTWDSDPGNVTAEVFWKDDNDITPYNSFEENISQGDEIYVVLSSDDSNIQWGDVVCKPYITFTPDPDAELYDTIDTVSMVIDTSRFTADAEGWLAPRVELHHAYSIYNTPLYQRLFGPLHKGWGQFAYRSEGIDADLIHVEKLVPPDMMVAGNTNTADSSAMDQMTSEGAAPDTASFGQSETFDDFQTNNPNFYNPYSTSSSWVGMNPDVEHWAWVGYGHQNTVGRDTVSNSVRTDWYSSIPSEDVYTDNNSDDSMVSITTQVIVHDDPVPPAYQGTPAKAVNKVNRSKSRSWSVGFLGAGYSDSKSDNTIEVDYMDLNGDRYPDIIGTDMVQYSQQWGGVGPVTELKNSNLRHGSTTHTESGGFSFSASHVTQERTACNIQQNAFFTMHSEGSGSLSGGGNIGRDEADGSWVDINGDGLPDFVKTDGRVQMNIGYDFIDDQNWDFIEVHKGVSGAISVGAGLQGMQEESVTDFLSGATNISQASIEAGVCVNGSYNQTTHMLVDINGDGLPDKLWRELNDINSIVNGDTIINTYVRYNLGAGRFSDTYSLNIGRFNSSASFSESLNLGLTYGFTVWGLFKVTLGLNGCPYNAGVTQDYVQLADVNADGLPDWVYSIKEDEIIVRYNQAGKTNLLKKVTNFTGSSIDMDYTLSVASFNQPSRGWMMTRVTTNDPLNPNGGGASITGYSYSNSYYDRYERMSYGFDSVVTYQIDPITEDTLRYVARCYNNRSLMRRGKLTFERTYGGDRKLYIEKEINGIMIDYNSGQEVRDGDCPAMAYPAVEATYTRYYEGGDTPLLITGEKYVYDKRHNLIQYINLGDFDNTHDDVTVDFSYYHSRPHNLIGLREWYKVTFAGSSAIVREAYFKYNDEGKLTDQMIGSGSDAAIYDFSYDSFGNLRSVKLPENVNGERMAYDYWYDNVVHTYPVKVEDLAFNNNTFSSYNYQFGKPVSVTSINGKTMTYTYDFAGRLTSVNSPMNNSGVPSVKNSYYVKNYYHHDFLPAGYESNTLSPHPYAITEHYDDSGSLITKTVVITDGFGRVLQTKKGLTAYGSATMQVSGRTIVDALGRTVKEYDPFTVPYIPSNLGNLEFSQNPILMTTTTYDELDRVTSKVMPLGIRTYMAYSIGDDQSGTRCFITTTRDPNNKITTQYTDYEGRQTQVIDANGGITIMKYDNLGQLIDVADPEDFHTSYGYDNFGRLVGRNHPDAGSTNYAYDPAGNIIYESNPLGEIYYDYTYYRLVQKRYSNIDQNNVTYIYGNSGNENGRIQNITDGSGSYECFYDDLGNVIEEHRAIAVPGVYEVYNFRMNYTYDSWGRMRTMVYPDGETVNYRYTWGGDLEGMDGNNGDYIEYIRNISYNGYGQKDHVEYGNNTMAEYSYDILHRLVGLRSIDGYGSPMQEISYTFDKVNNITGITNTAGPVNSMGGDYENSYNYDNLYRLVSSSGAGMIGNYAMNMSYSPSGRIKSKFRDVQSVSVSENVNMAYGYCNEDKPHAVRRMYDYNNYKHFDLRWDDAGNLGQVSIADKEAMYETGRFLYWTEDNRMHTAIDDRYYSYYAYDHSGERRLKLTGDNKLLDVNADFMATYTTLNEPTLYPSAYMVLTNKGYTKHYYAGTERVAARLGGGGLDALQPVIGNDVELQKKADILFKQSLEQVNHRVLHENNLECIKNNEFTKEELSHWIDGIPYQMKAGVELDHGQLKDMVHSMLVDLNNGQEKEVYFYHSDHLGSASWITDFEGIAVQHLQYLPYGEPYIDQRAAGTTYSERFRFTGKERDEETGYGYFGARYMDHELMTMWLSVDPMADKYPSISPYAYCAWNPVKLVDPDGRDIWEINNEGRVVNHIKDKSKDAFFMVDNDGKRKESISFKYGTIKGYKKATWFRNATSFNVSSESAGAELFKFFADNTMIEYGLINTESNGSTVMTNHKESSVEASKMAKEMNDNGQKITSIVHSHPNNSDPSGFIDGSKRGDKFSALQLLKSQGRLVDRYVYKPKDGSLVSYDNKQIYGRVSWGLVFRPSSERIHSYPSTRRFPGVGLPPR